MTQFRLNSIPRQINFQEARELVLRNLGLPTSQVPLKSINRLFLNAEAIRSALWALSGQGQEPIYVTRLLNVARLLSGVEEKIEQQITSSRLDIRDINGSNPLRETLDELETIGDLAGLTGGYWIPAPVRFVPLERIKRWILIGGIPSKVLPQIVQGNISYNGVVRILAALPDIPSLSMRLQPEEDWLGKPPDSVDQWAHTVLYGANMLPYESSESRCEFYVAQIQGRHGKGSLQYNRWVEDCRLPDGRYLVRRRSHYGPMSYAVAEVKRVRITATGLLDLGKGDLRRLCYGIDALAANPVEVKIEREGNDFLFVLRNEIPKAEYRLLVALGQLQLPPDGKYYPRYWRVPKAHYSQVAHALEGLKIRLVGKLPSI